MKNRKFIDTAKAYLQSGNGGNGCVSFRREKFVPKGGPDGGDGGRGGHVIIRADQNEDSLIKTYFQPHHKAETGGHGQGRRKHGANGRDHILTVPCGTQIFNYSSNELIADLVEHGQEIIAAKGGRGGLGNCHWKTSVNQAPRQHTNGEPGEQLEIRLDLKLMAAAGLVGMPNAGKSTLLTAISHAHPKTAAYPFTTLNPIPGTIVSETYESMRILDIPGIIKGAHSGAGLGHSFLKHMERVKLLVYVLDMAGTEGRNPVEDFLSVKDELEKYNSDFIKRPFLIAANKMDIQGAEQNLAEFVEKTGQKTIPLSAKDGTGLEVLKKEMFQIAIEAK